MNKVLKSTYLLYIEKGAYLSIFIKKDYKIEYF